jgi:cytochrome bd ubiquinol oxidase subunit I
MSSLDLARWQFGITTVYHFLFVPLTIGLAPMVAIMQTVWHRTGNPVWLRLTKFFGKLLLINFALGVVTGIVQEFQFGMNWSSYSRFVGDVFGAPLAMEGLAAFFLESTFLGLWIFGWDRLPKRIHLATIWLLAIGVNLSAYFILAANSFMQHPVGVRFNPESGRAELNSIWTMLGNVTALATVPHVIAGAWLVAGGFVLAVSAWHLARRADRADTVATFRPAFRFALGSVLVAGVAVVVSGHWQGQIMVDQQPMKMAAAEAACHDGTGFSVLSVGDLGSRDCDDVKAVIELPGLLSFLANGDFTTEIKGVNTLIPEYQEKYGTNLPENPAYGERAGQPIQYVPVMAVTYWGFRLMITFGGLAAAAAAVALWLVRKGTVPGSKWLMRLAVLGILAPFGANSAGWIFTEMGRQPFVVAPNPDFGGIDNVFMFTAAAVSPGVSLPELVFSVSAFTLVYLSLLVVEVKLLAAYCRGGVPAAMPELLPARADGHDHGGEDNDDADGGPSGTAAKDDDDVLAFAY